MGIDLAAFEFLLKAQAELGDFGKTVVLGRQRLLVRNEQEKAQFGGKLRQYRPDLTMDDIAHDYVDGLIDRLGGRPCHFMDNSAYEGAQVIHDLNEPLPPELHNSYDTVIDIGTLEHVFNIGTGMRSVAEMVRPGGQFLCLNVANHHLGHGFWQFGPEVFFRTFCPAHGYEARLADLYYKGAFHPLRDPEIAGRRLPLTTPGYTYVTFAARKVADRPIFASGWPVQADYVAAWKLFLARRAAAERKPEEAERLLRDAITEHPNNPLYLAELSKFLRGRGGDAAECEELTAKAYALASDNDVVVKERNAVLAASGKPTVTVQGESVARPVTATAAASTKAASQPAGQGETGAARSGLLSRAVSALMGRNAADATTASPLAAAAVNPNLPAEPVERSADGAVTLVDVGRIKVAYDDPRVPQATRDALRRGRYEFKEREIARRLLGRGDRVIELGAGMGVVSLTIADLVGGDAVMSFEANPTIIELARENVARSGMPVTLRHAIASPRPIAAKNPHIDFFVLNSFEASSTRRTSAAQKAVRVPSLPLEDEIATHRANVLVFDIEGFEEEIVKYADFSGIDKVIFEIHPKVLGRDRTLDLVSTLEAQGLFLRQDLIFGDVIAFERGGAAPAILGRDVFAATLDFEAAMASKSYDAASAIAGRYADALKDNAYFQYRLSALTRARGDNGIAAAERALELGSNDFLLFADLGALYCDAKRRDDAAAMLSRLQAAFPRSVSVALLSQRIERLAG